MLLIPPQKQVPMVDIMETALFALRLAVFTKGWKGERLVVVGGRVPRAVVVVVATYASSVHCNV